MQQVLGSSDLGHLEEALEMSADPCVLFLESGQALSWNENAAALLALGDCLRPYAFPSHLAGGLFAPAAVEVRFRSLNGEAQRSRVYLSSSPMDILWKLHSFRGHRLLFAYLRAPEQGQPKQRNPLFSSLTMHRILESMPVAIVTYSLAGLVTYCNLAARRLYGWGEEEWIGRPPPFPMPVEGLLGILESKGPDSPPLELTCHRAGPQQRMEVRLTISPWVNPQGYLQGYLEIAEDLSQIRSQERQLELSRRALVQLQKMEAVGRLAGAMAHDFNNLLVVVRCNSELQLASNKVETELLQEILDAGARGQELTQKLLTFARSSNRTHELFDLCEKLQQFSPLLLRGVRSRHCQLELVCWNDHRPILLRGDVGQLENVFMNLVLNAADASPEGASIELRVGTTGFPHEHICRTGRLPAGSYAEISVVDSGCGMTLEQQDHLFEPFFTTKPEGNGLGLAAAYGVIVEHGGGIEVVSQCERGTTVSVYLPIQTAPARVPGAETPGPATGSKGLVLLVEDLEHIRKLMTRILSGLGYQVADVGSAEAAELYLEEISPSHLPDLILSDVRLPGMTGLELARRVKQRYQIPVLLTSGYTTEQASREFAFLPKPFSPHELAKAVGALERKGPAS